MKRICLFAGYDDGGVIHDYVVFYIKKMQEISDVYYMADCSLRGGEFERIAPFVKRADAFRHGKYDFGSWQELILKIGWEKLYEYDELILANDSCFAPLSDMKPIFDKASEDTACDFWGMTCGTKYNVHLQSYFLVFKKNVILSDCFKEFFENVKSYENKSDIVRNLEAGLTKTLMNYGFIPKRLSDAPYSLYRDWKTLIKMGFPMLKVYVFTSSKDYKKFQSLRGFDIFLKKISNYDPALIQSYIDKKGIDISYFDNIPFKDIISRVLNLFGDIRKRFFQINIKKQYAIIKIFGISVINTYLNEIQPLFKRREFENIFKKR